MSADGNSGPTNCQTIKLVLFGGSRTGKTALLKRFLENKFDERYIETVEDMYQHIFTVRSNKFNVCFYDMGGSNEFPAMRRVLVSEASGFVIVCSTDVPDSIDHLNSAFQEITSARRLGPDDERPPFIIVLSKTDLDEDDPAPKQALIAKINQWLDFNLSKTAYRKRPLFFAEVSAKTGSNIKIPFEKLAEQMLPPRMPLADGNIDVSSGVAAIGVLAAMTTGSPEVQAKRGFSLYRKKQAATAEDKPAATPDGEETKKLERNKTLTRSFMRKAEKTPSKPLQPATPADEDCNIQ